ncbi:MAG: ADP-ribosylglycohydrolase family protein [Planctomycetes bacterium]|nr:ADP-ribosylglycohydrolase family protein [Planctomycetota bacterium]
MADEIVKMRRGRTRVILATTAVLLLGACAQNRSGFVQMPADVLDDKIQGGLIGQILGNLNGLPHENKYIHEPGEVRQYVPSLPEGARTDDDTDIEWVYIIEMQRSGEVFLPPERIVELWRAHISDRIWCANRYARGLMELGIEPPLTGRIALNPWSDLNLNTAAIVGSLLYGRGDFVETIRLAFNFGWDADCNAATAGCIVGVMKGRRWIDAQGWQIKDLYRNTCRPGLPTDETITRYGQRLADVARTVILKNGGEEIATTDGRAFRIRTQPAANVEPLPRPLDRLGELRREWLPRLERDLAGGPTDRARAAYMALCLDEAPNLSARNPQEWQAACESFRAYPDVIKNMTKVETPRGQVLRDRAQSIGLLPNR